MTMRCENCGQYGIRWMGRLTDLTHTECPHCGGANCQEPRKPVLTRRAETRSRLGAIA
jgi:predicted nucleic acid-binding Zn ribbon protein